MKRGFINCRNISVGYLKVLFYFTLSDLQECGKNLGKANGAQYFIIVVRYLPVKKFRCAQPKNKRTSEQRKGYVLCARAENDL